jgi:hypothetical protein
LCLIDIVNRGQVLTPTRRFRISEITFLDIRIVNRGEALSPMRCFHISQTLSRFLTFLR